MVPSLGFDLGVAGASDAFVIFGDFLTGASFLDGFSVLVFFVFGGCGSSFDLGMSCDASGDFRLREAELMGGEG